MAGYLLLAGVVIFACVIFRGLSGKLGIPDGSVLPFGTSFVPV